MDGKLTYKDAGVDTKEGERAVKLMKEHVKKTFDGGVLTGLGGFGSLYMPDLAGISAPVLVAGTDGVGTKLMIAFMMDKHDTVGQDCVAMCVNDVICQGAKPLFFIDYIATGRVDADKIAAIVGGVADGCVLGECALVGGETAEMPGLYKADEYDLAGFCVGLVDRDRIIDGKNVKEGDVIIGIKSNGLHSNGFSLVRKVLFDKAGLTASDKPDGLGGLSLGEILLTPTRIYTKQVRTILGRTQPKALIHITGGGFYENIPRVMPAGLGARIRKETWVRPKIFDLIQSLGDIDEKEMFSTFNMGIALMAIVDKSAATPVIELLAAEGEAAAVIGEVSLGAGVTVW
ncbi:MAG: phosphoribosylformylglycinamidine cyclo-ligase [Clostridiales Family XIII bacterium]|jgi:phosphoribosylformylglycinamidine cyclo-ligase|nr:phosphoribosylformylglycinamidine cyclo-ligase [Clostridiales Family XIII bacterium]